MSIKMPVSWPADSWPTDLTQPALTVEEFITTLRQKGAALDSLDPQLVQIAAFSYYCGSVAGGGHVDFICNNEADYFERATLAQKGALLVGQAAIAEILSDFIELLPSDQITDVYTAWADDGPDNPWAEVNGEIAVLSALDKRLFAVVVDPTECEALSRTLSGAAQTGFATAISASKFSATNPQYVALYAWLATYEHLDFGTFKEATAKTSHIIEELRAH